METRVCRICEQEKDILVFRHQERNGKTTISRTCKECDYEKSKSRYQKWISVPENREKDNEGRRSRRSRDKALGIPKKVTKESIRTSNKKYYENNKEEVLLRNRQYRENNKEVVNASSAEYQKERRNNDPTYRIHHVISVAIGLHLKSQGSSKGGKSCFNFLPYDDAELRAHIESLFEYWMTWKNHGVYDPKTWNDTDPTTWTWQIDHIIPKSEFCFISMEDGEFRKCWGLENLRPLSAKQNILEGVSRTRHITKKSV